jgi:hypothetical protein
MDNTFEVWRLDRKDTSCQRADGVTDWIYRKIGGLDGPGVSELFGPLSDDPSPARGSPPVREGDLIRTPDCRWLLLLQEGMYVVTPAVHEQLNGETVLRLAPTGLQEESGEPQGRASGTCRASRHRFITPLHTVIVGWDNPLQTFFAQVWTGHDENAWGDEPDLWVGCCLAEIPTVDELSHRLKAFAEVPAAVEALLRTNYDERRPTVLPLPGLIRR